MPQSQDPVKAPKLPVRFSKTHTYHEVDKSNFGLSVEERWRARKEPLGRGSRLRAVNEISRVAVTQNSIDYTHELEALAKFSQREYSSHFVRSFGWYESEHCIFIAMEYLRLGDLQKYLGRPLPESEGQKIAFQLLEALQFMHNNGFAHRDLKPAVKHTCRDERPDWWLKVGDFGLSKCVDQGFTALRTMISTLHYVALEILSGRCTASGASFSYTAAVDIWSVGVVVFHLLTGRLSFQDIGHLLAYARDPDDSTIRPLQDHGITEQGQCFVKELLCVVPTDRPSAQDSLSHQWQRTIPIPKQQSGVEDAEPSAMSAGIIDASGRWSVLDETELDLQTSVVDPSMKQARTKSDSTPKIHLDTSDSATGAAHNHLSTQARGRHDPGLFRDEGIHQNIEPGFGMDEEMEKDNKSKSIPSSAKERHTRG
ncbi:kinase-like domain-containing protein [Aspergillus cavernicola]|uniref:non-specific serine/threonine protein kinase n=1 Tax=Aspergillus cavernicola TaxID=176166 RepID=A0ABR4I7B0_9EURO